MAKLESAREELNALRLPKLYNTAKLKDPEMKVRYKNLRIDWEWYVSEFDGKETLYGFVCGHEGELGYISLEELVENNCYLDKEFTPMRLSEVKSDLRTRGLLR